MLISKVIFSFGVVSSVTAFPSSKRSLQSYSVKERHVVPRAWTRVGPAPKRDTIHLQIGLKQQNDGLIEQKLLETSDPNHKNYGKHLSHDEVMKIVTPSDETLELVQSWLHDNGILDYAHNTAKDMIHCEIPVEKAEQLLQTSYSTYRHEDGAELDRAPEWSLPDHLHDHIDIVQPTTSFFHPRQEVVPDKQPWHDLSYWDESAKKDFPKAYAGSSKGGYGSPYGEKGKSVTEAQGALGKVIPTQHANGGQRSQPDEERKPGSEAFGEQGGPPEVSNVCDMNMTTPQCVRTLYGTLDYEPQVPDRNGIGTCNYVSQTVIRADVSTFMHLFRPDAGNAGDELAAIQIDDGDVTQIMTEKKRKARTNKEADLDAQQAIAITYPTMFTAYHVGGSPPFTPDMHTPNNTNEPYLAWLDYALQQESLPQVITTSYGDDEQTVPPSYAKRVCSSYAQLGARGISIIFSSGDNGVGKKGHCYSNDGSLTRKFLPTFPAGCPWVTTVGSTEGFAPEIATKRFGSGSGFSEYFPRPEYQNDSVTQYVQNLDGLHQGLYNPDGRAYPDVSAQGDRIAIVWDSKISKTGGTSAAAPIVAGIISLLNDALIANGKPTLGFLNPLIYGKAKDTFTDIVEGSSVGCDTEGFPTMDGWDPVTGCGTLNFKKLLKVVLDEGEKEVWVIEGGRKRVHFDCTGRLLKLIGGGRVSIIV